MIRVGLTGGCCTGKSTVGEMFSRLGAEIVSADRIVHRLLREDEEVSSSIVATFGDEVLVENGSIDRAKIAAVAFTDKASLAHLTRLLYPKVRLEIKRAFDEAEVRGLHDACVAEVPLLFEGGALDLYHVVVVVKASYRSQLTRFLQRGGKSKQDLDRRISNQMDLAQKARLADYVIDNDGSFSRTFEQVKKTYQAILFQGCCQRRGPKEKSTVEK